MIVNRIFQALLDATQQSMVANKAAEIMAVVERESMKVAQQFLPTAVRLIKSNQPPASFGQGTRRYSWGTAGSLEDKPFSDDWFTLKVKKLRSPANESAWQGFRTAGVKKKGLKGRSLISSLAARTPSAAALTKLFGAPVMSRASGRGASSVFNPGVSMGPDGRPRLATANGRSRLISWKEAVRKDLADQVRRGLGQTIPKRVGAELVRPGRASGSSGSITFQGKTYSPESALGRGLVQVGLSISLFSKLRGGPRAWQLPQRALESAVLPRGKQAAKLIQGWRKHHHLLEYAAMDMMDQMGAILANKNLLTKRAP